MKKLFVMATYGGDKPRTAFIDFDGCAEVVEPAPGGFLVKLRNSDTWYTVRDFSRYSVEDIKDWTRKNR